LIPCSARNCSTVCDIIPEGNIVPEALPSGIAEHGVGEGREQKKFEAGNALLHSESINPSGRDSAGCLWLENHESRKQKTAPKIHLSEPFFIRSFLFNPFVAQLLTLLLIAELHCSILG